MHMRQCLLLSLIPAAAASFGPSIVFAAETVGWIAAIDREADLVVLDNGQSFFVPDDVSTEALTKGARVRITYVEKGAEKTLMCVAFEPSSVSPTPANNGERICSAQPAVPADAASPGR